MAPGNLKARLNRLLALAEGLPQLPTEAQARGARERLLRRLGGIAERCPELVTSHAALSPEEQAARVEDVKARLVERLRALGLRP